jgi:hypothetical protein
MSRSRLLILSAWILHAAAWFLPAVTGILGDKTDTLPGWVAFYAAFHAVVSTGDNLFEGWYAILPVLSSLSTILFVAASPWVVLRGSRRHQLFSAWSAIAAFVINSHWYVLNVADSWWSGLGVGYFLWWFSFGVLAIGLFDLTARKKSSEMLASPQPRLQS